MGVQSNAEAIRVLIRQKMSDGKPHEFAEIREYIQANSKREVTKGMMAGAMLRLVQSEPDYISLERGRYQYVGKEIQIPPNPYEPMKEPLEKARQQMLEYGNFNYIVASKEEILRAERAKKYIQQLDAMIAEICNG